MTRRKQATGVTHRKGLGNRHRLQRERLLRALPDGSPCPICQLPMWKSTQRLHADHEVPRAIAGPHALATRIVHGACNEAEGARLSNARRSHSGLSEPDRRGLAMPWP
jgi:hypothetical protein